MDEGEERERMSPDLNIHVTELFLAAHESIISVFSWRVVCWRPRLLCRAKLTLCPVSPVRSIITRKTKPMSGRAKHNFRPKDSTTSGSARRGSRAWVCGGLMLRAFASSRRTARLQVS